MTKVQAQYRLERPLDEPLLSAVARAHSLYGIFRVQVTQEPDGIAVEYDASRLTRKQVESALRSAGIPIIETPASERAPARL